MGAVQSRHERTMQGPRQGIAPADGSHPVSSCRRLSAATGGGDERYIANLKPGDYSDPGWYQAPKGTMAFSARVNMTVHAVTLHKTT
jgi:hypothetical protein